MFAVPGWSLSTETLKTQTAIPPPQIATNGEANGIEGGEKRSKKRKRGQGKNIKVTEENLGEMWMKYVERKDCSGNNRKQKERKAEDGIAGNERERAKEKLLKRRQADANDIAQEGNDEDAEAVSETLAAENAVEVVQLVAPLELERKEINESSPNDSTIIQPGLKNDEGQAKYERRKAKAERKHAQRAAKQANGELPSSHPQASTKPPPDTSNQPKNKSKKSDNSTTSTNPTSTSTPKAPEASPIPPIPTATTTTTKLTPLQSKMAQKLISARFRHLNEILYTTPSTHALSLFTTSPAAYISYHAGFRAQVAIWPSNPITGFISDVKTRGAVRRDQGSQAKAFRSQKKNRGTEAGRPRMMEKGDATKARIGETAAAAADPLPRTRGVCNIADLGCGDATLAGTLTPIAGQHQLHLQIQSFDLARGDGPYTALVTVADITDLSPFGVRDGSVDVAVCCLSLMGTNWVRVVEECGRIVRVGGEVWVAEIQSRFGRAGRAGSNGGGGGNVKTMMQKRMQDQKHKQKTTKKKPKKTNATTARDADSAAEDEDDDQEEQTLLETPSLLPSSSRPNTPLTDLSPFIAIWRKRGFHLKAEPDLNANKMFVKMQFIRQHDKEREAISSSREGRKVGRTKFIEKGGEEEGEEVEGDENGDGEEEVRVLKPCLYKVR